VYAPLKAQYDCMGEYLLVTNPGDIAPVVGKIVESYRHSFIQSATTSKFIETARKVPSVLKVNNPVVKVVIPEPEQPKPVVKEPVAIKTPEPETTKEITPPPTPKPIQPETTKPSKIVVAEIQPKPKLDIVTINTSRQRPLP